MENCAALAPLAELTKSFESDLLRKRSYAAIVARWPNVTDEEYLVILPTIWANDWLEQERLCHMPYRDFLRTRYWRAVSWRAKKKQPWCSQCAEYLQQLHVHHKTYVRRGLEWLFPSDLEVLCHSCHGTTHRGDQWGA